MKRFSHTCTSNTFAGFLFIFPAVLVLQPHYNEETPPYSVGFYCVLPARVGSPCSDIGMYG